MPNDNFYFVFQPLAPLIRLNHDRASQSLLVVPNLDPHNFVLQNNRDKMLAFQALQQLPLLEVVDKQELV